jgi:hypothetical protein
MFASQSKTFILSQLPEAQAPLFLQPRGNPSIEDEHEVQLIVCLYFELRIGIYLIFN